MEDFIATFKSVVTEALEYGIRNVPIKMPRGEEPPFRDSHHQKEFMAACHRGYEKAQSRILELVQQIHEDRTLSGGEKIYRELVYRRVIDAIAFIILQTQSHVARRLELHDRPPKIDFNIVKETKKKVDSLNKESRRTFAVLADLSTFIHVADILRVDLRAGSPRVSLIELKSGRVNQLLLSQLERYKPKPESLEELKDDRIIDVRHMPQAERILRQKIRIGQIQEVLKFDQGIDVSLNKPIKLLEKVIKTESYADALNAACRQARVHGYASATVQHCIHVGVGYAEDRMEAKTKARKAAQFALFSALGDAPSTLNDVQKELLEQVSQPDFYKGFDLLRFNLYGMSAEPFPMWTIDRDLLLDLIAQRCSIFLVFDLPAFIWLGRLIGLDISLSGKKTTGRVAAEMGARLVPTWGGHALRVGGAIGEFTMGAGMFGHFIASIKNPVPFLYYWKNK